MTLHFSHIGLTDALTFIGDPHYARKGPSRPLHTAPGDHVDGRYLNRYVILPLLRS